MSVVEFNNAEAKAKLERAIHQPVGAIRRPIWDKRLKSEVRQFLEGTLAAPSWEEVKNLAREWLDLQKDMELDFVGAYIQDAAETKGEEPSGQAKEDGVLHTQGISKRTKARARAMSELSALLTGEAGEPPQIEPIQARVRAAGGRKERTLHRWVVSLDIEAWVPAEEVTRVYRNLQQQFIDQQGGRTEQTTYEVAQFVWRELRRDDGSRATWPSLLKRWKQEHPDDSRFKTYNNFRQYFVRGEEATIPRYKWPTMQLTPQREAQIEDAKEHWIARLRRHEQKHGDRFLDDNPNS